MQRENVGMFLSEAFYLLHYIHYFSLKIESIVQLHQGTKYILGCVLPCKMILYIPYACESKRGPEHSFKEIKTK